MQSFGPNRVFCRRLPSHPSNLPIKTSRSLRVGARRDERHVVVGMLRVERPILADHDVVQQRYCMSGTDYGYSVGRAL